MRYINKNLYSKAVNNENIFKEMRTTPPTQNVFYAYELVYR